MKKNKLILLLSLIPLIASAQYLGGFGRGDRSGGRAGVALPIELIEFSAINLNCTVELRWMTATETNNDFFTIEKSINANDWMEIEKIAGNGNSNIVLNYIFIDDSPFEGIQYYRLKQTDYDGNFSYSKIISIYFSCNAPYLNIYPNPSSGIYTVQISNEDAGSTSLRIINSIGQTILSDQKIVNTSNVIDLSSESNGVYFVEVIQNGKATNMRIIKN